MDESRMLTNPRVLDACIGTEQAQINSCRSNDYSCLCYNYGNLLTWYVHFDSEPTWQMAYHLSRALCENFTWKVFRLDAGDQFYGNTSEFSGNTG